MDLDTPGGGEAGLAFMRPSGCVTLGGTTRWEAKGTRHEGVTPRTREMHSVRKGREGQMQ